MKFTVITLFPQLVEGFTSAGLIGQARTRSDLQVETLNPRTFTKDVHQTVDDRVFGGGDGMVMKVEPLAMAVESLRAQGPVRVIVLSPQGRVWDQSEAKRWAEEGGHVALVCGRYAGVDHRFSVVHADDEISLGDFVLNGGEVAALALIESVGRLLPGVLGNETSALKDSFENGLLECPQFTRPREAAGLPVPSPLLSGNHAEIEKFERAVSLVRTARFRPDLLMDQKGLEAAIAICEKLEETELKSLGLVKDDLVSLRESLV